MLTEIQYKTAYTALVIMEDTRNYNQRILLSYDSFMDENEERTFFSDSDKSFYNCAVSKLRNADNDIKIYVELYGTEDNMIYGDTLLIFTSLTEEQISVIFSEADDETGEYISPSEISPCSYDNENIVIIDPDGSNTALSDKYDFKILITGKYLWWD